MRIHYLQHVPFEGLGSMQDYFLRREFPVTSTCLYRGEPLPALDQFDWLVIMGGPMGVCDSNSHAWLEAEQQFIGAAVEAGKIVLGICLGAQLIAAAMGAEVTRNQWPEIGWFTVKTSGNPNRTIIADMFDAPTEVFHWHGDTFELPTGAELLLESDACRHQAFSIENRVLGLQFHLETTSEAARALLTNCGSELEESPYIQRPTEILSAEKRFSELNSLMVGVLDRLVGANL